MKITDCLFKIAEKNALMSEAELDEVRGKSKEWFASKAQTTKIGKWLNETQELWYVRLIVAFLFVFVNRAVWDYMHPENGLDDDDDL